MIKRYIAIIQTGEAIESALKKYGDFDEWFIKAMDTNKDQTKTFRVFEKLEFPSNHNLAGIIITGSSAMVTDKLKWSEATIQWLRQFIDSDIPILGVCYGHQLLARLLGGKVDWNPKGRELGQVTMSVTTGTHKDKLLNSVSNTKTNEIKFLASHLQSVTQLPNKAQLLGTTKLDPNHCFSYDKHIWGLQFHPEFTAEIVEQYIKERSADIMSEGLNPTKMIEELENTDNGTKLLKKFKNICFAE